MEGSHRPTRASRPGSLPPGRTPQRACNRARVWKHLAAGLWKAHPPAEKTPPGTEREADTPAPVLPPQRRHLDRDTRPAFAGSAAVEAPTPAIVSATSRQPGTPQRQHSPGQPPTPSQRRHLNTRGPGADAGRRPFTASTRLQPVKGSQRTSPACGDLSAAVEAPTPAIVSAAASTPAAASRATSTPGEAGRPARPRTPAAASRHRAGAATSTPTPGPAGHLNTGSPAAVEAPTHAPAPAPARLRCGRIGRDLPRGRGQRCHLNRGRADRRHGPACPAGHQPPRAGRGALPDT